MKLRNSDYDGGFEFAGVISVPATKEVTEAKLEEWRQLLSSGHVLVFKGTVDSKELRKRVGGLLRQEVTPVEDTRVVEGIGNIFYRAAHDSSSAGGYSVQDFSYYFFPWNDDRSGIAELAQSAFDLVARLNAYDPAWLRKQTPKDGVVQRFHAICYPAGSGHISPHRDPVRVTKFTSGLYVTEYGKDYAEGGYYILDASGEKVVVDHEVESGDMVLFPAHFAHGVDTVQARDLEVDPELGFSGRIFLNMTIIESHEILDRAFTVGA